MVGRSMWVHWWNKFANALRGISRGVHGQTSFLVHFPVAVGVLLLAWGLQCSVMEWSLLILCIGLVLAAELFNSSLEALARGLCREHNPEVGRGLDIASGAVLVMAIAAAVVGCLVLGIRFLAG